MVFSTNPLSLSVPDPAFESWLRDSGYLEILDQSSSTTAATTTSNAATPSITGGVVVSLFSYILTLFSLFTLNPFSKLTTDDFSGQTPSWTCAFFGDCGSYSFPSRSDQARLRVHENVKRYARNYASLFILFSACTLYALFLSVSMFICAILKLGSFFLSLFSFPFSFYVILSGFSICISLCVY